jgi:hypothetical protein
MMERIGFQTDWVIESDVNHCMMEGLSVYVPGILCVHRLSSGMDGGSVFSKGEIQREFLVMKRLGHSR